MSKYEDRDICIVCENPYRWAVEDEITEDFCRCNDEIDLDFELYPYGESTNEEEEDCEE